MNYFQFIKNAFENNNKSFSLSLCGVVLILELNCPPLRQVFRGFQVYNVFFKVSFLVFF